MLVGVALCVAGLSFAFLHREYHAYIIEVDKMAQMRDIISSLNKSCDVSYPEMVEKHLASIEMPLSIEHAGMQPIAEAKIEIDSIRQVTEQPKQKVDIKKKDIDFIWPIEKQKFWLSSYFGMRKLPSGRKQFHNGIDMAALKGTRVKSAASGIVERAYEDPVGYGKTIIIKHNKIYKTRYAHLDKMLVTQGQSVKQGQLIGHVGSTGNVRKTGRDASHLHFEVYSHEKRVNPLIFFS
ncbi:MAG: M23 family metallopeptidase [Candidatus Dependentiae bacterium]